MLLKRKNKDSKNLTKRQERLLFLLLLFGVAFYYNYHEIVFKRPQSIHQWRQSDCASIALNYNKQGMDFFHPETHNLTSDNGTSSKCATSEVPILYYAAATLYGIFGYSDALYRIFVTLLFLLGLYYLFLFVRHTLKDTVWAMLFSLVFFTSPVLVYYGNSFLSNIPALSFSIIGWYYFMRYLEERRLKWFYTAVFALLLATTFKVTGFFSFFAIAGVYTLNLFGWVNIMPGYKLGKKQLILQFVALFAIASVALAWIVYAHNYNKVHGCSYFSTTIFPVWGLDKTEIKGVWESIRKIWLEQYFHKSVLVFFTLAFLLVLVKFRRAPKVLLGAVLIVFLQAIVFVLMQFWTFKDHDYYTIGLFILPVLIGVTALKILSTYIKVFKSLMVKLAFGIFLMFNIYYAKGQLHERYYGAANDYSAKSDLHNITPYLREIGITREDPVIAIPDDSHVMLYLMDQKGWTEYTDAKFNRAEPVHYNCDSAGVKASIDRGAKYLIVNGIQELYFKPYLISFCINLKGRHGKVLIFDLINDVPNFELPEREINARYFCNAEFLNEDSTQFVGNSQDVLFNNGAAQSNITAFQGKYACKLNSASPYGMTISFNDLQAYESFTISVWRNRIGLSKGGVIASSAQGVYYNNRSRVIDKTEGGWEKIQMEFFVSKEMVGHELKLYAYNPEKDNVFFDNLEITRYRSVVRE